MSTIAIIKSPESEIDKELRPCLTITKLQTEKVDESGNFIVTYRLTFSVGKNDAVKLVKVQFITDGEKSFLL